MAPYYIAYLMQRNSLFCRLRILLKIWDCRSTSQPFTGKEIVTFHADSFKAVSQPKINKASLTLELCFRIKTHSHRAKAKGSKKKNSNIKENFHLYLRFRSV